MTVQNISTIGFIGAGHIGSAVAEVALRHGYRVVLSNSRGPETLTDVVEKLGDGASAATAEDAAKAGDLVVVTIPLKNIDAVPAEPLDGKIVIDTNNYYPQRDGRIAPLDSQEATSAGLLQEHLPGSKVVKAFNHIYSGDITSKAADAGTTGRRALAIFGDDEAARATVQAVIDELGFDVVDGGSLSESWRIEPGTPGYGAADDAAALTQHLADAKPGVHAG
jgi:predicted dinucleotide-binding enzyme